VRSFGVVDIDEFVEACLLLKEICSSWFGGFLFQSEMHTFVTAALLGMARLMRSMSMPRGSHQTASLLRLNKACAEAKGTRVVTADVGG
jgi:hypothetical protein